MGYIAIRFRCFFFFFTFSSWGSLIFHHVVTLRRPRKWIFYWLFPSAGRGLPFRKYFSLSNDELWKDEFSSADLWSFMKYFEDLCFGLATPSAYVFLWNFSSIFFGRLLLVCGCNENAMYPLLLLSPSVNDVEFRREQQRYSSCACVWGRVFNFVASFLHLVANTNCGCCRS